MLRKLYQTENIILSKADAILWIYKCLLNLAYYQAPLLKHSMADSFGGFQGSIHEENYTVFLTLPVPSQFYSITDRKINGKGLSLYYTPCTMVPSLYGTTKSSKGGRGEDGVSTQPCAQTWHARGTGNSRDDLLSSFSLLYILSWLISRILPSPPLTFLSEFLPSTTMPKSDTQELSLRRK